ncbi:MAG: zinc-dependent peptidase [Aquincola sp.]|nr:zinc-dependent peptidase [Aquincola sp.]MDH4288888.1 zinc-dependent peptidase [Aquincola sp.]MDH5330699.1 zinc-dependent peptidase [Aquincola sp.]
MIARWWQGLQRRREARALRRHAIPDELWQATLDRLPFIALRPAMELERLRRMASLFLSRKEFSGARGFVVDDGIALAVAVQACLPVLELGLRCYDAFVGIVMHADVVVARREVTDEDGIVHRYDEELAGEAMDGGPLMLSWADVLPDSDRDADGAAQAYNVVIHEFAHVLDMRDGVADGVPLLSDATARLAWLDVLMPAYDAFCERVVCGHDTVLDPYAAEAPDEFFAVASEAFFVTSRALKDEQPALYRLLGSYYRQDPAAY